RRAVVGSSISIRSCKRRCSTDASPLCCEGREDMRARLSAMVRAGILSAIIGSLLAVTSAAPAAEQPFNPTKERITTSTEMTPVDIEIIGSTSLLPDFHRLLPDLVMRLRLERAYVSLFLSEEQPGYEILDMAFDLETGLPSSLYSAVARGPRFSEH